MQGQELPGFTHPLTVDVSGQPERKLPNIGDDRQDEQQQNQEGDVARATSSTGAREIVASKYSFSPTGE
jgi:hypothetical protein